MAALGQLSEQLAASLRQQPGPGQGLAELTQPQTAATGSKAQQPVTQLDALEALRQEQARLKAEYDRMEVSSFASAFDMKH